MGRAFEKEYDEEAHLFDVVGPRFRRQGTLSAYDFFRIVRWKANRAISKVAKRLQGESGTDLEKAVSSLTRQLSAASDAQERFLVLVRGWRLRLPIASAILTVLYPEDFTVYDVRACDQVRGFHGLSARQSPDTLWRGYLEFKAAVERAAPAGLSLRDKDRFLWARSRHEDLAASIRTQFAPKGKGRRRRPGAAWDGSTEPGVTIRWITWRTAPPKGLGHGVGFYDAEIEGQYASLVAFLDGFAWLHGDSTEAVIHCIRPNAVTTARVLDAMKKRIGEIVGRKQCPQNRVTRRIVAVVNG